MLLLKVCLKYPFTEAKHNYNGKFTVKYNFYLFFKISYVLITFSLYLLTYNVGTSNPEEDQVVRDMLSMTDLRSDKLPDFFILGFQEVKAQPQNMLMDSLFEDPWSYACKELLRRDYLKIKSVRLQGLLLVIFCLRKHLLNVREIESEYTRTGLAGMWVSLLCGFMT